MELTFALPPSLGVDHVFKKARHFADILFQAGFTTVVPIRSYELLEGLLISGEVDAAWGPPLVCGSVLREGGSVILQAIRHGSDNYCAALLSRDYDPIELSTISSNSKRQLRAVWVDRRSMAGYLLPRHHLRHNNIEPEQAFEQERFLGSYEACFQAVIDCEADVTATYANSEHLGHVALSPRASTQLRAFSFTTTCPNDALILSPKMSSQANVIRDRFMSILSDGQARKALCDALNVDDLQTAEETPYLDALAFLEHST